VALHGIKLIGVTPGGTVAVYGPGPIGLCAMQIARGLGARNVVMVGRGHRLKVAGEMGADYIVDFEKEDPVKRILEITEGFGADEVLECSGGTETPQQGVDSVRKGGKISLLGFYEDRKVSFPVMTKIVLNEIMLIGSRANPNVAGETIHLFARGILDGERIVTHRFPLEKYEEAFHTFTKRKDGAIKVVVEP
jgi:L-iditol 2-dehydrogenase